MRAWMTLAWQQAKAVAPAPSPGIPYQTAAPVSAGMVAFALLATFLLLAAMAGGLLFARRRGWIASSIKKQGRTQGESIELIASRRLSVATTAHLVSCRGQSYLVVESQRGSTATLQPLAVQGEGIEEGAP